MDTQSKKLHGELVASFVDVYDASTATTLMLSAILGLIADAFGSMKASTFGTWVADEFGTGGRPSAEAYREGRLPVALRAKGIMSSGAKRGEGDAADAARVNSLLSRTRAIARAKANDATFDLERPFYECARDAQKASGKTSNRKGTSAKASAKPGKATTITVEDLPAEIAAAWIEAHLATACEAICNVLRRRKDAIRLPMMEQVRAGLVASK